MNLYETIGKSNPTYLLADPEGADAIGIPLEPGNGVVARGTVMARKETGLYAPAASAEVTETAMLCVLDETTDTDADAKLAAEARAYRAAHLIDGRVTLKAGAALTSAHKVILRKQGLVFDRMESTTETYNNEKTE